MQTVFGWRCDQMTQKSRSEHNTHCWFTWEDRWQRKKLRHVEKKRKDRRQTDRQTQLTERKKEVGWCSLGRCCTAEINSTTRLDVATKTVKHGLLCYKVLLFSSLLCSVYQRHHLSFLISVLFSGLVHTGLFSASISAPIMVNVICITIQALICAVMVFRRTNDFHCLPTLSALRATCFSYKSQPKRPVLGNLQSLEPWWHTATVREVVILNRESSCWSALHKLLNPSREFDFWPLSEERPAKRQFFLSFWASIQHVKMSANTYRPVFLLLWGPSWGIYTLTLTLT